MGAGTVKKNGKIVAGVLVVCIAVGAGIWYNNRSSSKDGTSTNTSGAIEAPKADAAKVEDIAGFQENTEDTVGGLKLPYRVENTNLVIENIGQYTGPFVEDGSDTPTSNVLSILVKNNSDQVIQYGEIKIKINDTETVIFKVSNLASKTSALIMESTGKVEYNKEDKYQVVEGLDATIDEMSMMEDKIEIVKAEKKKITIKNKTSENLGTVYVYYKNIQDGGAYLGGITYRAKFENVKAGATVEVDTSHYYKDSSQIVMVDNVSDK